ncbi:acetate--CoA ligase family protein [candidate division KSB1 bacterium]
MNKNNHVINGILSSIAADGRFMLYEHEVYTILQLCGLHVPRHVFLRPGEDIKRRLDKFPTGTRFVIKVVSEYITHKTEAHGIAPDVAIAKIPETIQHLRRNVPKRYAEWLAGNNSIFHSRYQKLLNDRGALEKQIFSDIVGFLAVEMVDFPRIFGSECIVGAKNDAAFGPVIMFGPGGTLSEFYAESLKPEKAVMLFPADKHDTETIDSAMSHLSVIKAMTGQLRGTRPLISSEKICRFIQIISALIEHFSLHNENAEWHIGEFECNPCVCYGNELVPLDGVMRFHRAGEVPPERPVHKIRHLLDPQSVGIIGISGKKTTPAGTILHNLLQSGIAKEQVYPVHPKEEAIQGCRCYESLEILKESLENHKIDLFVVGVPVAGPPGKGAEDVLRYIVEKDIAESILIVAAGFDETRVGSDTALRVRDIFRQCRVKPDKGAVANGPNTLGNVYHRKDTRFTPRYKSGETGIGARNAALLCQSGAFMIATISNLAGAVNPAVSVSVGNQIDLTFSDFLSFLKDEQELSVYGVYVEGFKESDGAVFNRVVESIVSDGRSVVIYKAGRTPEGRDATKGHTASIAGEYRVARRLLTQAGAYTAETFEEFQDMFKLCALLSDTPVGSQAELPAVATLSNAGFEKCAIGDHLYIDGYRSMKLADYEEPTVNTLNELFAESGLVNIVDIGKILDLTPMADDTIYREIVRTVLSDANVDCGLISIVPETGMLQTLKSHNEDFSKEGTVIHFLTLLRKEIQKPFVVCIESGRLYEPVADYLEEHTIPVFRSVVTAARMLGRFMQYRLRNQAKVRVQ